MYLGEGDVKVSESFKQVYLISYRQTGRIAWLYGERGFLSWETSKVGDW
jgi:hypothetical protein